MGNVRTELQFKYPKLAEYGISWFGYYSNTEPCPSLEKHAHVNSYEICYLESGMQPYYIYSDSGEEALYRLYGGEVFVTRPGEYHSTGHFGQLRGRLFWVQLDVSSESLLDCTEERADMLRNALRDIAGERRILRLPPDIIQRLTEAYKRFKCGEPESDFCGCALLSLFILETAAFARGIGDESYRYGTVSQSVLRAVAYIHNNLLSPALSLDSVAEVMHYSRSYAAGEFRREIGLSVHEYILRAKAEYACDLLCEHTVTETALSLNFSSPQHFSKAFREHIGMTPTEYKKTASIEK